MYLEALPMYKFQLKYLPEHIAVHEGGCAGSVLVAIREAEQVPQQHHGTTTTSLLLLFPTERDSPCRPRLLPGRLPTHGVHGTAPAAGATTSTHVALNRVVDPGVHLGWHGGVHGGVNITVHGSVYD